MSDIFANDLYSPRQHTTDANSDRVAEATTIIEEFMLVTGRAKREGSYVYETAAYGRVMQRARKFLEGTGR